MRHLQVLLRTLRTKPVSVGVCRVEDATNVDVIQSAMVVQGVLIHTGKGYPTQTTCAGAPRA